MLDTYLLLAKLSPSLRKFAVAFSRPFKFVMMGVIFKFSLIMTKTAAEAAKEQQEAATSSYEQLESRRRAQEEGCKKRGQGRKIEKRAAGAWRSEEDGKNCSRSCLGAARSS